MSQGLNASDTQEGCAEGSQDSEERLDTMPSDEAGGPMSLAAEREIKEIYRATSYVNSSEDTDLEMSYGQRKFRDYQKRHREPEAFSFRNTNHISKRSLHSSSSGN